MSSLRLRLLVPIGAGLALLVLAGGLVVFRALRETLERGIDETLEERAGWWAGQLELAADPAERPALEALGAEAFVDLGGGGADPEARRELLQLAREGLRIHMREGALHQARTGAEGTFPEIRTVDGRLVARSPSLGRDGLSGGLAQGVTSGAVDVERPGGRRARAFVLPVEDVPFAEAAGQRAWTRIRGEERFPAHAARVLVARDTEEMESFLAPWE